jgi:DNA-binding NarL/FixJ family response regulator
MEGIMAQKKRILILARKDVLLSCSSLTALLSKEEDFEAHLVKELPRTMSQTRRQIDLIILFPTSLDRVARTFSQRGNVRLLLVLDSHTQLQLRHFARLGVEGAVSVQSTYPEVRTAIRYVFRNLKYVSPTLITTFAETATAKSWSCLSSKELDIALCMTDGKRNIDIAGELNISPKTVYSYKVRIYRKLGIENAMQLMKLRFQGDSSADGAENSSKRS